MPITAANLRKAITCRSPEASPLALNVLDKQYAAYLVASKLDGFLLAVPDELDVEALGSQFGFLRQFFSCVGLWDEEDWLFQLIDCEVAVIKYLQKLTPAAVKKFFGSNFCDSAGEPRWIPPEAVWDRVRNGEQIKDVDEFLTAEELEDGAATPPPRKQSRAIGSGDDVVGELRKISQGLARLEKRVEVMEDPDPRSRPPRLPVRDDDPARARDAA